MRRRRIAFGLATIGFCLFGAVASAEDKPVRIGVLSDMSSVYSDSSGKGSVVSAELAAEDAGLILGRKVEIVSADHQNKPDVGSAISQKWYEVDGVDMITDVPNSGVGAAVQGVSRKMRRLALLTGSLSSDLTGASCSPYFANWAMDTWGQSNILGRSVTSRENDTWFFIGANYKFGKDLTQDASNAIQANGGKVLGSVFAPLNTSDFSSFLLQAQSSGAKVIGLANASGDTLNTIKQAAEFEMQKSGQRFVAFLIFINDVKGIGLNIAQGLQLSVPFYWDIDDASRAFATRFEARMARKPTWNQAAVYSAVSHYLKAVKAAGTTDSDVVMQKMRELPINDFMSHNAVLRADGRVERDTYLFEVKTPAESKGAWDLYKRLKTISGKEATRPLDQGACPLVSASK